MSLDPSAQPQQAAAEPATTALVQRCLQGDQQAWNMLIARYARLVHSVPVRHGLAPHEVDDVGQETFLALAQSLHTVEDPERLPGWLVTTARRYTWRTIQRRRGETPLEDADSGEESDITSYQLVSPLPSPSDLVDGWGRQEALNTALRHIGERCRDLLTLVFLDASEPGYDEIASQLGMPKGSIGPTRNRCLQQLRSILRGLGFHGER